jgi:TonB family protein
MRNRIAIRIALVAAASFLSTAAWAKSPTPPVPLGNPGEWVTTDDYPLIALRYDKEGVTGFRLEIDKDGKASNCSVTSGSGANELDDATCRLVMERARFTPARDSRGRPVVGTYANRVRWILPEDQGDTPDTGDTGPMEITNSFVVGADGSVSECMIERYLFGQHDVTKPQPGECPPQSSVQVFKDASGKAISKRVRITTKVEVSDP